LRQFLQSHPGGAQPILRSAGKDATSLFNALHPPGTLEPYLPTIQLEDDDEAAPGPRLVGLVDQSTIVGRQMDDGKKKEGERTPLAQIVGLPDFEVSCFCCEETERKRQREGGIDLDEREKVTGQEEVPGADVARSRRWRRYAQRLKKSDQGFMGEGKQF
jgi:hypothetical protein